MAIKNLRRILAKPKSAVRDFVTGIRLSLSPTYFNPASIRDVLWPSVLIIGAQRAGTTSLHDYLSAHPQLISSKRKEVHYFDINYQKGPKWYARNFPVLRRAERMASPGKPVLSFETTPYYLFHPAVPGRVAADLTNAKFIVLLRNPVQRAISHYKNETRRNDEVLGFEAAMMAEPERLRGEELKLVEQPDYYSHHHHHHSYIERGRYDIQLERWFRYFPRQRFLILQSERLFSEPHAVLREITDFLEIGPFASADMPHLNASREKVETSDDFIRQMTATFEPHRTRLEQLTGLTFNWT